MPNMHSRPELKPKTSRASLDVFIVLIKVIEAAIIIAYKTKKNLYIDFNSYFTNFLNI